jgi:hypothetical protein
MEANYKIVIYDMNHGNYKVSNDLGQFTFSRTLRDSSVY